MLLKMATLLPQYLGSVIVVRVRGKQSTEEACLRLRVSSIPFPFLHSSILVPFQTSTENMQKLPDVILSVAWKGVKFIDGKSKVSCHGNLWSCDHHVTSDLRW